MSNSISNSISNSQVSKICKNSNSISNSNSRSKSAFKVSNPILKKSTKKSDSKSTSTVSPSLRSYKNPAKGADSPKRPRRVVVTLNNYTTEEYKALRAYPHIRAGIIGKEVAPSTGTPHLQCAFLFTKAVLFSTLKKDIGFTRASIFQMRGSPTQAFEYCRKEGTYEEWGDLPNPGKRNDLAVACEALRNGQGLIDLTDDPTLSSTIVRNYKGLQFFANCLARKQPLREKKVIWLYGETGTGKTRYATEIAEIYGDYWISSESLQWFDGYNNDRVVIIDDIRTNHCKFSFLLRLLDRYEIRVPIKGGFVRWNPQLIVVTAPYSPQQMWNLRREGDINQLTRRCTHIIEMPANQIDEMVLKSIRLQAQAEVAETVEDIINKSIAADLNVEPTDPVDIRSQNSILIESSSEEPLLLNRKEKDDSDVLSGFESLSISEIERVIAGHYEDSGSLLFSESEQSNVALTQNPTEVSMKSLSMSEIEAAVRRAYLNEGVRYESTTDSPNASYDLFPELNQNQDLSSDLFSSCSCACSTDPPGESDQFPSTSSPSFMYKNCSPSSDDPIISISSEEPSLFRPDLPEMLWSDDSDFMSM